MGDNAQCSKRQPVTAISSTSLLRCLNSASKMAFYAVLIRSNAFYAVLIRSPCSFGCLLSCSLSVGVHSWVSWFVRVSIYPRSRPEKSCPRNDWGSQANLIGPFLRKYRSLFA